MAESILIEKSKRFALKVIRTCKELRALKCEGALINQFLRSGTSIGANIREAFYGHGEADFIAKLQIAGFEPRGGLNANKTRAATFRLKFFQ